MSKVLRSNGHQEKLLIVYSKMTIKIIYKNKIHCKIQLIYFKIQTNKLILI